MVSKNTYGDQGGSKALWPCERRVQHVDLSDSREMVTFILGFFAQRLEYVVHNIFVDM